MELVSITFENWHKYNPRKEFKSPRWFAMSNRITEDDQIQTLSDKEFRAFVHLICLASQSNKSGYAEVNLHKAERVTGLGVGVFRQVIDKICEYGICTRHVRDPNATLHNTTEHNTTLQDTPPEPAALFDFSKAYNLYPLKIKGPNAERRFKEQIRSEKDEADLHLATKNYCAMLAIETWRRPKQTYAAFLGTESTGYFWRDFINWKSEIKQAETADDIALRLIAEHKKRQGA